MEFWCSGLEFCHSGSLLWLIAHSWSIAIQGHCSVVQGQNPQICHWTQRVHSQSVDICDQNSSKVGLLMFPVGIHGWSWNSEVQGQGTSVAFVIGILAGTFGTLVFRVGTLVSNSLFVGLTPCMYHYRSSFIFLAEFLKKCKPQKVPKP